MSEGVAWWQPAVFYQVYPRSFADADGDGVGDLKGIRRRLDYLTWLGVDALWLSPFYPSPMADFGYDVSDYCGVDPLFGSIEDFDRLLTEAHERGIRLIVDWVANHTSDQHPWFVDSRSSRDSRKRRWYLWRDPHPSGGPPNNWRAAFAVDGSPERAPEGRSPGEPAPASGPRYPSAWTSDRRSGQYYLHLFLPQQPELNWANPEVVEAMHDVLRFWLDRGVDGFRADALQCIAKPAALPDDPVGLGMPKSGTNDSEDIHPLIRDIRRLIDSYGGNRVIVGEINLMDTARVARYYGAGDELHLAFNFLPLHEPWEAGGWRSCIEEIVARLDPIGAWPTWVLSNHDNPRHRTRYGGSEARARAAAVLLLTLRGTPFLYAGEELGLEDALIAPEQRLDPGGRDGCRAPIPWTVEAGHGWPEKPWLPLPPEAKSRSVEAQRRDGTSILFLYRRLLALRRASPALRTGSFSFLPAPEGVLVYERASTGDRRAIAINFTASRQDVPIEGDWSVGVASDGLGEGVPFPALLHPHQAVVLFPR